MQNTLENKAKFFAQYYGKKIIFNTTKNGFLSTVSPNNLKCIDDTDYLRLNPIKSLMEFMAIEIAKILSKGYDLKRWYKENPDVKILIEKSEKGYALTSIWNKEHFREEAVLKQYVPFDFNSRLWDNNADVVDYLRSISFAVPWRGLSVEQLIEYGWVKLKSN